VNRLARFRIFLALDCVAVALANIFILRPALLHPDQWQQPQGRRMIL